MKKIFYLLPILVLGGLNCVAQNTKIPLKSLQGNVILQLLDSETVRGTDLFTGLDAICQVTVLATNLENFVTLAQSLAGKKFTISAGRYCKFPLDTLVETFHTSNSSLEAEIQSKLEESRFMIVDGMGEPSELLGKCRRTLVETVDISILSRRIHKFNEVDLETTSTEKCFQ